MGRFPVKDQVYCECLPVLGKRPWNHRVYTSSSLLIKARSASILRSRENSGCGLLRCSTFARRLVCFCIFENSSTFGPSQVLPKGDTVTYDLWLGNRDCDALVAM